MQLTIPLIDAVSTLVVVWLRLNGSVFNASVEFLFKSKILNLKSGPCNLDPMTTNVLIVRMCEIVDCRLSEFKFLFPICVK